MEGGAVIVLKPAEGERRSTDFAIDRAARLMEGGSHSPIGQLRTQSLALCKIAAPPFSKRRTRLVNSAVSLLLSRPGGRQFSALFIYQTRIQRGSDVRGETEDNEVMIND